MEFPFAYKDEYELLSARSNETGEKTQEKHLGKIGRIGSIGDSLIFNYIDGNPLVGFRTSPVVKITGCAEEIYEVRTKNSTYCFEKVVSEDKKWARGV